MKKDLTEWRPFKRKGMKCGKGTFENRELLIKNEHSITHGATHFLSD